MKESSKSVKGAKDSVKDKKKKNTKCKSKDTPKSEAKTSVKPTKQKKDKTKESTLKKQPLPKTPPSKEHIAKESTSAHDTQPQRTAPPRVKKSSDEISTPKKPPLKERTATHTEKPRSTKISHMDKVDKTTDKISTAKAKSPPKEKRWVKRGVRPTKKETSEHFETQEEEPKGSQYSADQEGGALTAGSDDSGVKSAIDTPDEKAKERAGEGESPAEYIDETCVEEESLKREEGEKYTQEAVGTLGEGGDYSGGLEDSGDSVQNDEPFSENSIIYGEGFIMYTSAPAACVKSHEDRTQDKDTDVRQDEDNLWSKEANVEQDVGEDSARCTTVDEVPPPFAQDEAGNTTGGEDERGSPITDVFSDETQDKPPDVEGAEQEEGAQSVTTSDKAVGTQENGNASHETIENSDLVVQQQTIQGESNIVSSESESFQTTDETPHKDADGSFDHTDELKDEEDRKEAAFGSSITGQVTSGEADGAGSVKKNVLRVSSLYKSFGRKTVVKGVEFSMTTGEVLGLLGPNGAGKTTTFYMIVGFYKPTSGDVFLDEKCITHLPMYKRARAGISYLPQEPSVFRKLTVEENIWAILETRKDLTRAEKKQKLNELIDEFAIGRVRKQQAYTLSGGERRRTEIARSLAIEPKFLLLDEPFAGIDPIAVADIKSMIRLLSKRGIGILITDHNVRDTLEITDRAIIISTGTILVSGGKEDILKSDEAREIYLGKDFSM